MANLVEVLRTGSAVEGDLCKAQLESAGIPVILHPGDAAAELSFTPLYGGPVTGTTVLLVAEADFERARALLAELHVYEPAPATAEEEEPDEPQSSARWSVATIVLLLIPVTLLLALGWSLIVDFARALISAFFR
jgi:hypothetical protein